MPDLTDNHDLNLWAEGEQDWQHRDDMNTLDTAVEIRDTDANKTDYVPKLDAKYFATDTNAVYLGDGSDWNEITHKDTQDHIDDTTNPHSVTASQANALSDSGGTVTGDIDLDGANRLTNIGAETEGLWWELDSSTAGQHWGKVQFTDANGDDVYWTSNRDAGDALKVVNTTIGVTKPIFHVSDAGQVSVGEGDLSVSGSTTIGSNTEISESASGSTVLENTAGNPINIQLSPSGRAFLSGNTTETTIGTQDQWEKIAGAWDDAHMNFLSHDGTGVMTYDGDVTTQIAYDVGGSYSSPDNNATYEIAMFKDESVKSNTTVEFSPPRSGEVLSLPPIHGFTDTTTSGMDHSVRVRCTSGTSNLTVQALSFRIKG